MKRQGFTLVELLVVLGVIAILLSIVMPAIISTRKQSNTVACGSNIKQLLFTMIIYVENNNTFPIGFKKELFNEPPEGRVGYHMQDNVGWWWFNFMGPLYNESTRQKNILLCPSKYMHQHKLETNILCGNYGANQSICRVFSENKDTEFEGLPLKSGKIHQPGQTLLLIDSGYALINWWQVADAPPQRLSNNNIEDASYVPGLKINTKRELWPGQEKDAIYGRHINKMVNIGFADGHVECRKADDVLVQKQDQQYKNNFPLWSTR